MVETPGGTWELEAVSGTEFRCCGHVFRDVPKFDDFAALIPGGPKLVIDAGACLGQFRDAIKARWPDAVIHSFEPVPELWSKLNESSDEKRIAHAKAVSDEAGTKALNLTAHPESNSFLGFIDSHVFETAHAIVGSVTVPTVRLDDEFPNEKIDLLKLDVQGWEINALKGATEILKRGTVVYAEVAFVQQYEGHPLIDDVDAFMLSVGYARKYLYASAWPDTFGDAIYVPVGTEPTRPGGIRLNLGAGVSRLDGFTPIDRKNGSEVYPLPQLDNSVEEIRASHILEHFSFADAPKVLSEWIRVLKPGGKIRLAVPDFTKCVEAGKAGDMKWPYYLFGGQQDSDDFHKSCWTEDGLRELMESCGLAEIRPWQSPNTDCAALPISLNLEGIKSGTPKNPAPQRLKVTAVMGIPRFGCNESWGMIYEALLPLGIPLARFGGVFWGQCMQRGFNDSVAAGTDWILTIDHDSIFTAKDVSALLDEFARNPHIDALAAMQVRRGSEYPLMTIGRQTEAHVTEEPVLATTAHFGLTLIRVDALTEIPKPWFYGRPDAAGEWGDNRLDDDIWFWHQWRLAGKNVYVSPRVRIGHMESMISEFDDDMKVRHVYPTEWRKARGLSCKSSSNSDGESTEKATSPTSAAGLPRCWCKGESQNEQPSLTTSVP